MGKAKFVYAIRGYRYAPESFHIYKGLLGQKKTEIPLSDQQRSEVGTLYLTQSLKAAVDYVKRIERDRERKCRLYTSYGFFSKEEPHSYLFCGRLRCREDAPVDEKLNVFREFKEVLKRTGGRVEQSVEYGLDGHYRPVNVKSNYLTADYGRPVKISLIVG